MGYEGIWKDRESGQGGGCATFIRNGLSHRHLHFKLRNEGEYGSLIEIEAPTVVNIYLPCLPFSQTELEKVMGTNIGKIIWCGECGFKCT
jgi:hypothetical protein